MCTLAFRINLELGNLQMNDFLLLEHNSDNVGKG